MTRYSIIHLLYTILPLLLWCTYWLFYFLNYCLCCWCSCIVVARLVQLNVYNIWLFVYEMRDDDDDDAGWGLLELKEMNNFFFLYIFETIKYRGIFWIIFLLVFLYSNKEDFCTSVLFCSKSRVNRGIHLIPVKFYLEGYKLVPFSIINPMSSVAGRMLQMMVIFYCSRSYAFAPLQQLEQKCMVCVTMPVAISLMPYLIMLASDTISHHTLPHLKPPPNEYLANTGMANKKHIFMLL